MSLEQHVHIVEIYFQNRSTVLETYIGLCPFYGQNKRHSEQVIHPVMDTFRTTYSLHDVRPPTRQRNVHTETINLLKEKFNDKVISRNGPVNCVPRSFDLTPPDYFLLWYVYAINEIRPEMWEKADKNWTNRMGFVTICRGGHMHIQFFPAVFYPRLLHAIVCFTSMESIETVEVKTKSVIKIIIHILLLRLFYQMF